MLPAPPKTVSRVQSFHPILRWTAMSFSSSRQGRCHLVMCGEISLRSETQRGCASRDPSLGQSWPHDPSPAMSFRAGSRFENRQNGEKCERPSLIHPASIRDAPRIDEPTTQLHGIARIDASTKLTIVPFSGPGIAVRAALHCVRQVREHACSRNLPAAMHYATSVASHRQNWNTTCSTKPI